MSYIKKLVHAAAAAGLVVATPVAGAVLLAPAAHASISICCSASYAAASQTDHTAFTATITNGWSIPLDAQLKVTELNGNVTVIPVSLPKDISDDYYDNTLGKWVLGVPSKTTVQFTLPLGATVMAFQGTDMIGAYTNPNAPAPVVQTVPAVKPIQVGNDITVLQAPAGTQYVVVGGAGKPLAPGTYTLSSSMPALTIAQVAIDPTKVIVSDGGPWAYAYVAPAPAQLVPVQITQNVNLYTIPSVQGYYYTVNGQRVAPGDYYVPVGGVTVQAVSNDPATLQLVGQTSWPLSYVTPPPPNEGTKKVMVCHQTGNGSYVSITVSVASLRDPAGHAGHDGDIWPQFKYEDGDELVTVPAKNWTEPNAEIYAANCTVETPAPPSGGNGGHDDHGTDKGGGTNGGNTGGTTTPSGTTSGSTLPSGTTNNTVSVSTGITTSQSNATPSDSSGEVMKADTAADPSDASNLGVFGSLAVGFLVVGTGGALMLRRRS